MEAIEKLMIHVKERPAQLLSLKQNGTKIVGHIANGYMPEELLYACGAIPVGLIRGGDYEPVIVSEKYLFHIIDTFCRAQIGYLCLGKEPVYQLPDLMVIPITDRNITAIADIWQLYTDVDIFKLGVPRYNRLDHAFEYYVDGLRLLIKELKKLTDTEITDERLKEEIELSNRIRTLLERISLTRVSEHPPISGKEFISLNHATYYADRHVLLSALESIFSELQKTKARKHGGPRIMLVGSTLADGDDKVVNLLEEAGASIVIEEFSEGIRHYRQKIELNGDPVKVLAERYLRKRIPPAFFHDVLKERFDYLMGLIKEFSVEGVLWYSLMYRDSYDREGLLFSRVLQEEAGLPLLRINSDYDITETEAMRTRIETFIEIIKHGR